MKPSPNRIAWMDRARAFAILSVVACHAVQFCHSFDAASWNYYSPDGWFFRFAGATFGRLGVPILLGLTGAFVLNLDFSEDDSIRQFHRTRTVKLVVCILLWTFLYTFYLAWHHTMQPDFIRMISDMLHFTQVQLGHMWYAPMIIGMYVLLPYVSRALRGLNLKTLALPLLLTFGVFSLLPTANVYAHLFRISPRTTLLDLGFSGGLYGLYIILGWAVARKDLMARVPKWLLWVGFLGSFGACVGTMTWCYNWKYEYQIWYDFSFVLTAGLFLTELFRRTKNWPLWLDALCEKLSRRSFAVYFLHFPLMAAMFELNLQKIVGKNQSLRTVWMFAAAFFASLAIIEVLKRIPVVKKYLLYM